MKTIDKNTKPNLKDHPTGFVRCADGFWTYSRRARRMGMKGWLFTSTVAKDAK